MKKKSSLFAILCLSALVSLRAYAEQPSTSLPSFKIGVIQSLTGAAAEYGKTVVQSLQLAAETINNQRNVHIELIIEDDQTQPKSTVSAFQRLQSAKVPLIIGATWDYTTNSIVPLAKRTKTVLLTPSSLCDAIHIDEGEGYVFAAGFTSREESRPFAEFISRRPSARAALVYTDNAWGEAQRVKYKAAVENAGGTILDEVKSDNNDSNDWSASIPLLRAKKPDLVILLLNRRDIETFLRRAKEQNFKADFYSSINGYDAVEGAPDKTFFNGLCFSYPLEQLRSSETFTDRYNSRFGEAPRIYADIAYDSLFVIAEALKRSKENKVTLQEALKTVSIDGISGVVRYDPQDSFCSGRASLVCVREGIPAVR